MKKTIQLITAIACFALGGDSVHGALSYWDANGTDPGAAPSFGQAPGFWGLDANWSTSSAGTATPGAWTDNNTAVFSAGTDAIFDFQVDLLADQSVAGMIFEEGNVTVGPAGNITLTGAGGPINVGPNTTQPTIAKIGSILAGTVGLTKTGSGTLFFINTGTHTYTGNATNINGVPFSVGTIINEGALSVGDGVNGGLGAPDVTKNHVFTLGTNAVLIFNRPNAFTFSGLISGNGSAIKDGGGSVKLGSGNVTNGISNDNVFPNNEYTGDTIINLGKLTVAGTNGHAIPTGPGKGNVIINTNGQLDVGIKSTTYPMPFNIAINGLFGNGSVTNSASDRTNILMVGNNNVSSTFSGKISKAGGLLNNHVILTKIGTGTLTLDGQNSYYAGPTTVMAGTLLANTPTSSGEFSSTGNSAVIVNSGATLGGIGIINGPVTIEASGTLSPGGSVGNLTLKNSLTLAGNLLIEVNKPTNDVVSVTGALSNTGTGNTVTVVNVGGALSVGDKFQIFNKAMANGGALTVVSSGGVTWNNNLGVDGSITVASVPAGSPQPSITSIPGAGTASVTVNYTNTVPTKTYFLRYKTTINEVWATNLPGKVAAGFFDSQTDSPVTGAQRYYQVYYLP
jgi:fibronectin-binding autotransporter adhesin